ncbi:hypothetical protein SAMN05192530_103283 [Aureimonas jatrophae]|uniref:Uncharacterized protein n=2 Tax=Aureimonas jatrophae TaxID=1166073 RepID=A0A1H0GRM9_9HYPH|nr:hypothetical protein SAMN05192530_103283 [Aureimonas jatrophae]
MAAFRNGNEESDGMVNAANEDLGLNLRQSVSDPVGSARPEPNFSLVSNEERDAVSKRDWSAALDLVREASEAIRIRDERATEMEIEHRLDAERASDEIRTLQEQIEETELRLAETEGRLRVAEARAAEAEAWLARMHDAIVTSFSRVVSSDDADEAELRAAFANSLGETR